MKCSKCGTPGAPHEFRDEKCLDCIWKENIEMQRTMDNTLRRINLKVENILNAFPNNPGTPPPSP